MPTSRRLIHRLRSVQIGPRSPANGAEGCIVLLHGLGADGHDLEPIVPYLQLSKVRFVLPHAPKRNVTINDGARMPAWYDLETQAPNAAVQSDIAESHAQIRALLDEERQHFPSERIVLAGFSQGGAMALHVGVRYPHRLMGIVALSAYEVDTETRWSETAPQNSQTPILFCHGTRDDVVPIGRARQAHDVLRSQGRPIDWCEYPIAHEVAVNEIHQVSTWVKRLLAQAPVFGAV